MADVGQVLRDLVREIVREEIAEQKGLGPPSTKTDRVQPEPDHDFVHDFDRLVAGGVTACAA